MLTFYLRRPADFFFVQTLFFCTGQRAFFSCRLFFLHGAAGFFFVQTLFLWIGLQNFFRADSFFALRRLADSFFVNTFSHCGQSIATHWPLRQKLFGRVIKTKTESVSSGLWWKNCQKRAKCTFFFSLCFEKSGRRRFFERVLTFFHEVAKEFWSEKAQIAFSRLRHSEKQKLCSLCKFALLLCGIASSLRGPGSQNGVLPAVRTDCSARCDSQCVGFLTFDGGGSPLGNQGESPFFFYSRFFAKSRKNRVSGFTINYGILFVSCLPLAPPSPPKNHFTLRKNGPKFMEISATFCRFRGFFQVFKWFLRGRGEKFANDS